MTVTMHKAVVYRAYPTREQAALIERTCGCARFVYNRMLADKIAHYEKTGETLKVTPARYKREFPWLKEVDSFALCNAQLNLDAAYRNFFRRVKAGEKHGFPKYKAKHRSRCCYKTNFVNGNIRFEGDERYLRLPKLGSVRVRQKREIDPSWRIKSVTVEHTSSVMSAATASREPRTCRLGSGRAPCAVAPMTATLTLLGTSGTKV